MGKNDLLRKQKWFGKEKIVIVTGAGRRLYLDMTTQPARFGLPFEVREYLNKRSPRVGKLFPIQEEFVSRGLLFAKDNVSAFAYPGSGKTLLAELGIVQTLGGGGKALFCTPFKALDWQKYEEFSRSFSTLGVKVAISDGDNPTSLDQINNARVVIGTYERIAGALRRNESWLRDIALVCADEITLLADEQRGSTIDLLLTLMHRGSKDLRIITLSSVVGNALSIARWLDAKPIIENSYVPGVNVEENIVYRDGEQAHLISKDGDHRVQTISESVVDDLVKGNLDSGKTTLIFVGPRSDTMILAEHLKKLHKERTELAALVQEFQRSPCFENTFLTALDCELIKHGIAFHHAGLHKRVRRLIEKLLSEGKLNTIVATGTLTHGVDFKIDSVILDLESVNRVHPLFIYEYINYKGRAGRPGKSNSASVFILCRKERLDEAFSKYFLGTPEGVIPKTVFQRQVLAGLALTLSASKGAINANELSDVMESTLSATGGKRRFVPQGQILDALVASGFMAKVGQGYQLTGLGTRTNSADLTPEDALRILELGRRPSLRELIAASANMDLVMNFRTSARKKDPTLMLLDWIDEVPIDSIVLKYHGYWDDGDITLLGEYCAIALDKISIFLNDKRVTKLISVLGTRLRLGVKEDVAKSDLTRLSLVAKNKARFLARRLFETGYGNLGRLAREDPSRLAKLLGVEEMEAASMSGESTKLLQKP